MRSTHVERGAERETLPRIMVHDESLVRARLPDAHLRLAEAQRVYLIQKIG